MSSDENTTDDNRDGNQKFAFSMTPEEDSDSIRAGIYPATIFEAKTYEKAEGVVWLVLTLEVESTGSEPPPHIEAILCIAAPRGSSKYVPGLKGAMKVRQILTTLPGFQPDQSFSRYKDLAASLIGATVEAVLSVDGDGIPNVREVRAHG